MKVGHLVVLLNCNRFIFQDDDNVFCDVNVFLYTACSAGYFDIHCSYFCVLLQK